MTTGSATQKRLRVDVVGSDEDQPRLLRAYGKVHGGEAALVMRVGETRGLLVHIQKETARAWRGDGDDAPRAPSEEMSPRDAVALVRAAQKDVPKPGPVTLRGRWRGELLCGDGKPVLRLLRALASYGVLSIESDPAGGWSWSFARTEKWFGKQGDEAGRGLPTLASAIEAGVLGAMRLVREACSFRDTRRRSAVDATWAETHPVKLANERPDPVAKLKEREDLVPTTKPARKPRGKKAVEVTPPTATVEPGIAAAFGLNGMPGVTVAPLPGSDPVPESPTCPKELKRIAEITKKDAEALAGLTEWERGWKTTADASSHLARARTLIRHAQSLVRSPLCQGKERDEAKEAIGKATAAYEGARKALAAGRTMDAAREVRHIGEKVALAAAKSAKACAKGQMALGGGGSCQQPTSSKSAATPKVTATSATNAATAAAPRPARARPAQASAPAAASGDADPAKDKALLDAFASAIKAAMAGSPAP